MEEFLEKIYKENSYLKKNLDEWAQYELYYEDDSDYSFEKAYNVFKRWEKKEGNYKNFIKVKELEIKWIMEKSIKHNIILNNFKNRTKYSKRQKELYKELQELCEKLNNLNIKERYYTTKWQGFDRKIDFILIDNETREERIKSEYVAEYRFVNNTIEISFTSIGTAFSIFKKLLQKLKNNQETEILSHFFIRIYRYNNSVEFVPITEVELEDWHSLTSSLLVIA